MSGDVRIAAHHDYQADVVVIGGGLAGLVTALELLDHGRDVVVLDRDGPAHLGGLARESFGGVLLVDTRQQRRAGIHDSPALALADWLSFGDFPAEEDPADPWPRRWARTYIEHCTDQVGGWLNGLGLKFLPVPLWVERGLHGDGNSVPRWHVLWGTGQYLVERLVAALDAHPRRATLTLRFGHRVEDLELVGGRVVGCRGVADDNATFRAQGGAVVVASGGVGGALDRVRTHWPAAWGQAPRVLLNGSHRFADGLVHDAVGRAGGVVAHLDRMWNYAAGVHHWRPRKPDHGLSLVPPRSALWLDRFGRRIGPMPLVAGFDTHALVAGVCTRSDGQSWQVMNRAIALRELAISGAEFNPAIRDRRPLALVRDTILGNHALVDEMLAHCPDVVSAPDVPELVARMNALDGAGMVDLAAVGAAIDHHDAEIARGPRLHNDEQFRLLTHLRRWRADRLRLARPRALADPRAGPLIAIREFVISRKSLGGIRTDLDCRVVGPDGGTLSGLYAVGEAAGFGGGNCHGKKALEGTFLGGCILTARRAASAIATTT